MASDHNENLLNTHASVGHTLHEICTVPYFAPLTTERNMHKLILLLSVLYNKVYCIVINIDETYFDRVD